MTAPLLYDVTVLGGGPAGAACASLLARWGHRVQLLTRPPRGPSLAESLTPSCGKLLEQIGVLGAINSEGFIRSTGHTVRWGGGVARVERFAHGVCGWQVLSSDLESVLLREARTAGVRVHRSANVRRVVQGDDGLWHISYEARETLRHVSSRWVMDCTGRSGVMSRATSGRVPSGARTTAIVGLWQRRPSWALDDESHTYVESYAGGWAWSVPVSKTRRQVTVMLDPARTAVAGRRRLATTYREELARTSMMRDMTLCARLVGAPWGREASSYTCDAPARPRLLLVGDASSCVDPLSSYGVKKALASAWLGAVVVHSCLGDASLEAPATGLFVARERAMVASLRGQLGALAREAADAHAAGFWSDRTEGEEQSIADEPDVAALRADEGVRTAFDAMRRAPSLRLRRAADVRQTPLPLVMANRVVLSAHLVSAAFPNGIRYLRNVDLLALVQLAPRHAQVPELYAAYGEAVGQAPLPDVLAALAVLVAKGLLEAG